MKTYCLSILLICLGISLLLGQDTEELWNTWEQEEQADTVRLEALKSFIQQKKYLTQDPDSTYLLTGKMLELAQQANLPKWESRAYYYRGISHYYQKEYEKAIDYYQQSLDLKLALNDKKGAGSTANNIALAYRNLEDFPKALEYNLKALEMRREISDEKGMAGSLQNLSSIYYNQGKLPEALKYAVEGVEISRKIGNKQRLANNAVSAANVYSDLGELEQALAHYQEALPIYEESGNELYQAVCLDNVGNIYFKQGNYPAAQSYQEKGLQLRLKRKDPSALALSYINLGSTYHKLERYEENLSYCLKGLEYAEAVQDQRLLSNACSCLSDAYKQNGDMEHAFLYFQRYTTIQDTIEALEKARQMEEIESKYQLKEKEALLAEETNAKITTRFWAVIIIGLLVGVFLWIRNRLRQRKTEAELAAELERAEADKLRELDQLKSNFFANISHEFRTPLTLIMSPLEQMLKGSLEGDPAKYQRIMYRNGQRLQDLINQLLDLSKLESGHLRLDLKEGKLSQFLRATALSFGSLADRKQISYQVLGPSTDIWARFDQDVLEKILMNLISNAFKFTPEEGRILVAFELDEEQLSMTVEDSGIGIPASELDSIFDRFYSMGGQADLQKSSGIGLALTKELVDLYQGSIAVQSVEGKGSQFKVKIPIEITPPQAMTVSDYPTPLVPSHLESEKAAEIVSPNLHAQAPRILIVEDNADVREYLKEQLRQTYVVKEAENGKIGLEIAQELQPELIVSDVMMPEMDGNELCKTLKTDPLTSHIPVILLTAKADQQDKLEGLETGADAYLTKPFDHTELQLRIRKLIDQRQQLREKFRSDFRFAPSELQLNSVDTQFLEKIRSLIETNMEDETFSVVELSREIGMSRSNLFRKLKALTNQSPNQVIREMRLIRAKELLEKGAGNATEVAFMVGFNSATYFSKCFKDHFGVSPSQVG